MAVLGGDVGSGRAVVVPSPWPRLRAAVLSGHAVPESTHGPPLPLLRCQPSQRSETLCRVTLTVAGEAEDGDDDYDEYEYDEDEEYDEYEEEGEEAPEAGKARR